ACWWCSTRCTGSSRRLVSRNWASCARWVPVWGGTWRELGWWGGTPVGVPPHLFLGQVDPGEGGTCGFEHDVEVVSAGDAVDGDADFGEVEVVGGGGDVGGGDGGAADRVVDAQGEGAWLVGGGADDGFLGGGWVVDGEEGE